MERINTQKSSVGIDNRVRSFNKQRDKMRGEETRYTLILHSPRKKLGLTITEYVLADTIHKLSTVHSAVSGWCFAKRETLAENISVSRATLFRAVDNLVEKNIVEIHPQTHHLRTTELWHLTIEVVKSEVFGSR